MQIQMAAHLVEHIQQHALAELPNECCGLLVGTFGANSVLVQEAHAAANVSEGERPRRFLIDPQIQLRLQRECRERRLDIVGSYHSHPGGEARPSSVDAEAAWPDLLYLIVAVRSGEPQEMRCWRWDESGAAFVEDELELA